VPLAIAAVTAGLVACAWLGARARYGYTQSSVLRAVLVAGGVGLSWAGCVAFVYDAVWSGSLRSTNLLQSVAVAPHIGQGALFFGYYPDYFATVKSLRPEVTVAFPRQDGFQDFRPLAQHWLEAGRPVFAVLTPGDWNYLRGRGQLEGLEFRVAAPGSPFPLMQIRAVPGAVSP
jgi:hypothetical protein